jgi:hypothetical protein
MSASNNPKARGDAKLKTLPSKRQEDLYEYVLAHNLRDTLAWLKADGVSTSLRGLSEFRVWYELQEQWHQDAATTEGLIEQLKREVPALTEAQLDELGQRTFSLLAIREKNANQFIRVRGARFKAEVELEKLKLRQAAEARHGQEFAFEREKWVQLSCDKILAAATDARTKEIAEMAVPNGEKIKLLRKHWFADVDELEATGTVKLPKR